MTVSPPEIKYMPIHIKTITMAHVGVRSSKYMPVTSAMTLISKAAITIKYIIMANPSM
ncbi:hypothetical protein D3C76_1413300 [compost metagenome]